MAKIYNKYHFGKHHLLKEKKERVDKKRAAVFVCFFALSCLFFLLLLRAPYFDIERIVVRGLKNIPREEVVAAMGVTEGTSIWEVSPPELEERIMALPSVKEVRVERRLPRTLEVFLQERLPVALVPYQHYYLELSDSGTFIGIRSQLEGDLPLISGLTWGRMEVGREVPDPIKKEILVDIMQEVSNLEYPPISEINIYDPDNIIIYTMDGLEVLLGGKEEISRKLAVLGKLYFHLDQDLFSRGYLDLRIAETPVFKSFSEKNN